MLAAARTEPANQPQPDLWEQYRQTRDVTVRNRLVLQHEAVVRSMALKIVRQYHMNSHLDDLINEGVIALIDAVEKYEPDRQVKFLSYASIKIKGAMIDFSRKQMAGYTRKTAEKAKLIRAATDALQLQLCREPDSRELAAFMGVSLEQLKKDLAMTESIGVVSLELLLEESSGEHLLKEPAQTGASGNPEASLLLKEQCGELAEHIRRLSDRQQLVLSLYYLEELDISQIAELLETDPMQVSQIRFQAVRRLKRSMNKTVE